MKEAKWKQQYRDKENIKGDWKGSFSNFKYRIAMPISDGSNRIWRQTMDMYQTTNLNKSKIRNRNQYSISKVNDRENEEIKWNKYSDRFSFLSTVAGTKINNFVDQKAKQSIKTQQIHVKQRPLTGLSVKKPLIIKQSQNKKQTNSVIYQRVQSAIERNSGWVIKRPISGRKQKVQILTSMQFQKNRERIENIKNKITSQTQYSTPISRIGYNMQHEALFKYQHLELLSKGADKKKFLPIQYAIKDLNIKTHHVYDSQKYHPIAITLFSQFFHTNSQNSRQIRQQYLQNWFKKVTKSYDPQKFVCMYKESFLSDEQAIKYEIQLNKISSQLVSPLNPKWIEQALNYVDRNLISEDKMVLWVRQIWALYEKSMKKAILDYQLLNYYERKRLHISCIPKKLNMTQKISKYGGYSVKLFDQHAFFVNIGRCRLQVNLCKYNILSLSLQKWFYDFKDIKLVEAEAASFLATKGYAISLHKFIEKQQLQFKQMQSIFRGIWFRGCAWIIFKQMFLQSTTNNPWKQVIEAQSQDKIQTFKSILLNHKSKQLNQSEDMMHKSDLIYQQLCTQLKVRKIFDSSIRLISIHTLQLDEAQNKNLLLNDKMLKSINQQLNLQLFDITTNNIKRLQKLFQGNLLFELEPVTNHSTKSIVLPYTCQQSIEVIKQIFERVMGITYMCSGVYMQKQIKLNNSYLSIFNLKEENRMKVEWKSYEQLKKMQIEALIKIEESYLRTVQLLTPFLQFECLLPDNLIEIKQVYTFEQFRKDVQLLKNMRQRLNQLETRYESGIFVVNTLKLHKQFKTRIDHYLTIIEQKMRKQISHDLIHLEGQICEANIKVFQVNTTPEELCDNQKFLDQYQLRWSRQCKLKCKQVIRKTIQFVTQTDAESPSKGGGTFFKSKVSNIYKHMISFDINIIIAREQKQKQRNNMQSSLHSTKARLLEEIEDQRLYYIDNMEGYTYIPSKFRQYMEEVIRFRDYIFKTQTEIMMFSRNCNIIFGEDVIVIDDLKQQLETLKKLDKMYGVYWEFIFSIYLRIKNIHKTQIQKLEFFEIQQVIIKYAEGKVIVESAFDPKDPYVKYLNNLSDQIIPLEKYLNIFKLLTLSYLQSGHYNKYDVNFASSPVKKILDDWQCSPPKQKDIKLIHKICQTAEKQWQMKEILDEAKQSISKQIKINDGRFIIQLDITSLQKIEQKQYLLAEIQQSRQVAARLRDLKETTSVLKRSITQLLKLKSILFQFETRFYKFQKLFKLKYRHLSSQVQNYKLGESMWKQTQQTIINKPIISQIFYNKHLNNQIINGNQIMKELQRELLSIINNLYEQCELLRMVGKPDVYNYLVQGNYQDLILKCFNNIQQVTIQDRQVISVGKLGRNNLILMHPIKIEVLYPEKWIGELQDEIKNTLLTMIKKHKLNNQQSLKELPQIVEAIILMVQYSQALTQNIENQAGLLKILETINSNQNNASIITFINHKITNILQKNQKLVSFPKFQLNQNIIINYKNSCYDFEGVYHDTISNEENKMIACMFGWGFLDLNTEKERSRDRDNCLIALSKTLKIVLVGECQNQELQIVKKMNRSLEGVFTQ